MSLEIVTIKLREAFDYIGEHHRHHKPPVGSLFQLAVADDDGVIRGVAVVGRPVARMLDDGLTVEVTRLCTDGAPNACSLLYGASRRVAKEKGYRRGLTFILDSETGTSLRAAGWDFHGPAGGGSWSRPSRGRDDPIPTSRKQRWGWGAWPSSETPSERSEEVGDG